MGKHIFRTLSAAAAIVVAVTAQSAWAQDADHGRISYSTDEALVLGQAEDDWSFAGINTLILEGDRVWADDSGAIELEFPAGYYVRLADGSEVEVQAMPPDGVIRGWVGSFYVQRLPGSRGDMTFDTGAARFTLDPGTVARFDVLTDGATTLSVTDGRVSVFTDDGQVLDIGRGYRTYIDPGLLPSAPERFSPDQDTFGAWNDTRINYIADATQPEPIRQTRTAAPIGTRDLDNYGEWVYVDNTQYWRPIYVKQYVPYRHGYWSHVPRHGYVWVGHYPFDYVTSHYGYWHYNRRHGWLWSYTPVYAPARVVSVYYGDVLFWAPATRYGYPVYGSHFDFTLGGFNFSLAFTSFAYSSHVFHHHHHHHYFARPLHRHIIHSQPRHARPQLWNHHNRSDLDYWQAVHRNTNIGEFRAEPERRVRGFTQSEHRGEARTVAANLQERRGRADFRTAADRRATPDRRTSTAAAQRVARAREIDSIRDRGERVTSPERRATERTERTAITRTPTIDRREERTVRVDRTPVARDRAVTRDQLTRDRTGRTIDSRREVRTLPTDRGVDSRTREGIDSRRERTTLPTDRSSNVRVDRGSERTLPTDRGIDRGRTQMPDRRESVGADRSRDTVSRPTDRGTARTLPTDRVRSQTRDQRSSAIDRSPRGADVSGRTLDPSRGLDRSQVSIDRSRPSVSRSDRPTTTDRRTSDARIAPDRPTRSQVFQPDRGPSREVMRTPPTSRVERPSAPSREPIVRDTSRGVNYRSPDPAPTTRSAPAPTRSSATSRGSAPSRSSAPSMRGNAPTAPTQRSISPSAPSTRGGARSAPSQSRVGNAPTRQR